MLIFLALACAHTSAVWKTTPSARIDAPTGSMAVVASDRRCQSYADALIAEFRLREGVLVDPAARTRLVLERCSVSQRTEVDITQDYGVSTTGLHEQRSQAIRSQGKAVVVIEVDGQRAGQLSTTKKRVRIVRDGDLAVARKQAYLRDRVVADVVEEIAQRLVPVSEVVRRRWYTDPEPGTARDLHNRAVDAERAGDLAKAIEFAEASMAAHRTPRAAGYLRTLRDRQRQAQLVELESRDTD